MQTRKIYRPFKQLSTRLNNYLLFFLLHILNYNIRLFQLIFQKFYSYFLNSRKYFLTSLSNNLNPNYNNLELREKNLRFISNLMMHMLLPKEWTQMPLIYIFDYFLHLWEHLIFEKASFLKICTNILNLHFNFTNLPCNI